MNAHEHLRQLIDQQQDRLRAAVPPDRVAASLAILGARDRFSPMPGIGTESDLVDDRRLAGLGGNKALQLCLESIGNEATSQSGTTGAGLAGWGDRFLQECGQVVEAGLVLAHCETGFMRMVDSGNGMFDAWIATRRAPASWRERADIEWWASWLAGRNEPELLALRSGRPDPDAAEAEHAAHYRQLADVYLEMMAWQMGYPPDAEIGGCSIRTCREVLEWLIAKALQERDRGNVVPPQSERSLVAAIAADLAVDPALIGRTVAAITLDRENAAWHAAVPSIAAPPLVRVDPDRLVWSVYGLTTESLLFLARELKRRDAQDYHNAAFLREDVFRQDLYALFEDKRFVTSPGRIELRRNDRTIRTDIDAVVFDRKTGTIGLFELKSQDPFVRSTAELVRQRDNFLYANRQVSGVLDWLKRNGVHELLGRVDTRTAKRFRIQKVYPFVLGRYLAHFNDGPEPDRRAAWGSWPQLLRLLDGQPARGTEANPIASLFTRLSRDTSFSYIPADDRPRTIAFGDVRLTVHPSHAAFQASAAG